MLRIACALAPLTALLFLAAPVQAWTPVAAYDLPNGGVATCLRDAGQGRFGLLGAVGRTSSSMDLLQLGSAGLAPSSTTTLGWLSECPAVSGAPGGAVTFAGSVVTAHPADAMWKEQMHAAAAGGPEQAIGASVPNSYDDVALAVNASGAAVLAWIDASWTDLDTHRGPRFRLLVATRPAGGTAFGPAKVLDRVLPSFATNQVVAGIDAAGRATLAWIGGGENELNAPVVIATTNADGVFGLRQSIPCCAISDLALAVNPDGRALLATLSGPPQLYERAPSAERFRELPRLTGEAASSPMTVALGLGTDGEAVVALSGDNGRVSFATRPGGGSFGALRGLTHPPAPEGGVGGLGVATLTVSRPSVPLDRDRSGTLSAAVRGDRFAVAWTDASQDAAGVAAYAAFGSVTGGVTDPERLGNPCRDADAVRAVVLADGTIAVALADNGRTATDFGEPSPLGDGRLSVVRDGATPPSTSAPPKVTAAVLATPHRLHLGDPLQVRISCAGVPCDARLRSQTRLVESPWVTRRRPKGAPPEVLEREEAESRDMRISVARTAPVGPAGRTVSLRPTGPQTFVAPRATARRRVVVTACSPDGTRSTSLTLHPRLRGASLRPMPRIMAATVTRHGRHLRVAVRTDRPVYGMVLAAGRPASLERAVSDAVVGRGRSRFVLRLTDTAKSPIRSVELTVWNRDVLTGPSRRIRVR